MILHLNKKVAVRLLTQRKRSIRDLLQMFMDKKKKDDEELAEEHGQRNEQMQMLMKLVEITSVYSLEGHIDESSQTKANIAKLTDKNDIECYPILKIEDLLATLAGGQKFTKLHLSQAYKQVYLAEQAKQYVNTHKGF